MLAVTARQGVRVHGRRAFGSFGTVAEGLTALHAASGLPWLALVPLTTVALRTAVTLPLSIWHRRRLIKQQELRRVVQAVAPVAKLRLAAAASRAQTADGAVSSAGTPVGAADGPAAGARGLTPQHILLLAMKETRRRQRALFAENGVQLWKNAVLPAVQLPLWVGVSLGIRQLADQPLMDANMPQAHVLSHLSEQTWLTRAASLDLGVPLAEAPMLVPVVLGVLAMVNVEYNGRLMQSTGAAGVETTTDPTSRRAHIFASIMNLSRISSLFLMGVSSQAPLLLSLYWLSSQLYSLLQNMLLEWLWPYRR
ncbi:AFR575Cp [Eremothecium gossypii ATCC 10895]|uniref:AFR575Cp n=1 Tax=Eremothecium gossypii (strain ATCC 10895 / CBS 109.51 / FGSC 9923 / NRRL Y-1056) TaxID=284811 RepID=Q752J9_EREGS|nr:AFR575Cp [Eremothecium gossypii ATCC 10895]AAS53946.1 AFR575Cp [Eremothecium gossypii ATCC 10895]AEY98259.1 FAFR575Cp [Eremothecium gossypii FDAG1]